MFVFWFCFGFFFLVFRVCEDAFFHLIGSLGLRRLFRRFNLGGFM